MGWSIPTYNTERANGADSNWRLGMFELIRAVHEREDVTKQSRTAFHKGDESEVTTISYADLLGLVTTGPDSLVAENLDRIRTYIVDNAEFFTEDDTNEVPWTVANLGADISADLTVEPTHATDAAYWQMLQDALDRLIYPFGILAAHTDDTTFGSATESDSEATIALAWAGRAANSYTGGQPVISATIGIVAGSWIARVRPSAEFTFKYWALGNSLGSVVARPTAGAINAAYMLYTQNANQLSSPVSFSVGGETVVVSSSASNQEVSVTPPSLASDPVFTNSVTVPSTSPFVEETSPSSDVSPRNCNVSAAGSGYQALIRIYMDISGELTDQA